MTIQKCLKSQYRNGFSVFFKEIISNILLLVQWKLECVKKMNALTVNTLVTGFSFFYAILIEHYDHTGSVIQCSDRLFGAKLRIFSQLLWLCCIL